ncbi:MAG: homoserine dehydrogenase [Lachnospiraceae bacterium]|nr:homoserine dehydrogenase [Candidatus Colinaster equi]
MIKVAVLGYGTVGSGVVQVIQDNAALISKRVGDDIEVKYILDLREFPGDKNEDKVVHDINVILDDPEVSIVCETMGGVNPAFQFSKDALAKGKSVCTSNKELVENHGPELIALAKQNNCNYLFEASVGGGIPIIRPMNSSLAPEEIVRIMGILNGTTNFILTKMAKEGAAYADVLKQAQELGYAERNPEADVEGHDAGRKIAILSSLMTGKTVKFADVHTEGITKIETIDFEYAAKMGKSIKLIAMAEQKDGKLTALVAPFMIGADHPLNGVNGVFNAIYVTGNMLGDVMFYGQGAGKLATASAVVSDVIECARNLDRTLPVVWDDEKLDVEDYTASERCFFVRAAIGSRSQVLNTFGSINEIRVTDEEFAFVTNKMSEQAFNKLIASVDKVISTIRVAE